MFHNKRKREVQQAHGVESEDDKPYADYLFDLIKAIEVTQLSWRPDLHSKSWFPAVRFHGVLLRSLSKDCLEARQTDRHHMVYNTSTDWDRVAMLLSLWINANCAPKQLLEDGKCTGLLDDMRRLAVDLGTAKNRSHFKWRDRFSPTGDQVSGGAWCDPEAPTHCSSSTR